ncbi:ribonuclease HII [Patescibacteria group bacterium]|nr:ribonuclease HII [Patescibacteria group bacterium]
MHNLELEKKLFKQGYNYIAGVDEVGRGPLAGPVISACVLVDINFLENINNLKELNDSKKMSLKNREKIFSIIQDNAVSVGIGICSPKTIDKINILQASLLSSKKAVLNLSHQADMVLMDGKFKIPNLDIDQENIIQGDAKIAIIALASVIAKVYRDKIMTEYDNKYPGYDFAKNKGYGTAYHRKQIEKIGPCKIHRYSFAPIKDMNNN